jgi:hypothetical protein
MWTRRLWGEIPPEFPTHIEAFWKAERLKEPILSHREPAGSIKKLWFHGNKIVAQPQDIDADEPTGRNPRFLKHPFTGGSPASPGAASPTPR